MTSLQWTMTSSHPVTSLRVIDDDVTPGSAGCAGAVGLVADLVPGNAVTDAMALERKLRDIFVTCSNDTVLCFGVTSTKKDRR